MFRQKDPEKQPTMWIATSDLPVTAANDFYAKLDEALKAFSFGDEVRRLAEPFYCTDPSRGGRPGIDPEVYFKMLMVGFFENVTSERGIAARCADSLSIRQFLHYELTESTPDHSSLSVIRQRFSSGLYREVFGLVLQAMKKHKLLKGKRLGIDTSVLEANAAMRSLEHRMTGEDYWQYVKRLASEAGVDPKDSAAVRRFDKKRPEKKMSNDEWQHPHDPDAKIGRTKQGTTRMIYKPEHVVDLDTGAIVDADVRPGDEQDMEQMSERVLAAEERMNVAIGKEREEATVTVIVSDKGYYAVDELIALQKLGIRTVISDPIDNRRLDKLKKDQRAAVRSAKRSAESKYGKELTKRRGMYVERSFAHTITGPKARKVTLRGSADVLKRHVVQAMCMNLSLLMRKLIGIGTAKQAMAAAFDQLLRYLHCTHITAMLIGTYTDFMIALRAFFSWAAGYPLRATT